MGNKNIFIMTRNAIENIYINPHFETLDMVSEYESYRQWGEEMTFDVKKKFL